MILSAFAVLSAITTTSIMQPPDPDPSHVFSAFGVPYQADKDGQDWKFDAFGRTILTVEDGVSSTHGSKGFGFNVQPGNYRVSVVVTARHSGESNIAWLSGPVLAHSEQGSVLSYPEYMTVDTTWTECVFEAGRPMTASEINGNGLHAFTRAAIGNDADMSVDIQSVRIIVAPVE